jgi:hypothetical protein
LVSRFKRIAMEYHDQIVPGTLELLRRVLSPTHEITVHPAKMEGCGILLARRRGGAGDSFTKFKTFRPQEPE